MIELPEQAARREILRDLLANGVDRDRIRAVMAAKHGMTGGATDALIDLVREEDGVEEATDKKYYKRNAMRRLLRAISKASVARQYSAAAKLEETLMRIQGTEEHREIADVDAVVAGAMTRLVARMTAEKARAMIREHTRLRPALPPPATLPGDSGG